MYMMRVFPPTYVLFISMKNSARELFVLLAVVMIVMLVFGSIIYYAERYLGDSRSVYFGIIICGLIVF